MWAKSLSAIVGGCLVSISAMLNIYFVVPLAIDTRLLIALLLAFPLWVATMVWCYACHNGVQAWQRCGGLLLLSTAINIGFVLG